MDSTYKGIFNIAKRFFLDGESNVAYIPYYPQKTESFSGRPLVKKLPRISPESVGVNSLYVKKCLEELEADRTVNLHSILMIADGGVFCEANAPSYSSARWHLTHSMCKTLTGLAIGMLYDEGKISLESKLSDFFKVSGKNKSITVHQLLNMSSNVSFAEGGSVTSEKWMEDFLNSSLKEAPGSKFSYNSMNSYMLGVIAEKISGVSLFDYLNDKLFTPLEITNVFWERSPEGYTKGGWGLYISTEDIAKVALMLVNGGVYNGSRILSEEYISLATTAKIENPKEDSHYDYGYHMWVNRNGKSYLFNGMFGQNVMVYPESKIVIAFNSGNDELFQNSDTLHILSKYFDPDYFKRRSMPKKNKKAEKLLRATEREFFKTRTYALTTEFKRGFWAKLFRRKQIYIPKEAFAVNGKSFYFPKNNTGILPLIVRFLQNNHTKGLNRISFEIENDSFYVLFQEGDAAYRLKVGFSDYIENEIDVNGEKYCVSVLGQFTESEVREKMLKLEINYTELPNKRRIGICFIDDESVKVRIDEVPGEKMMNDLFSSISGSLPKVFSKLALFNPDLNINLIRYRVFEKIKPVLIGSEKATRLLPNENDNEIFERLSFAETAEDMLTPAE